MPQMHCLEQWRCKSLPHANSYNAISRHVECQKHETPETALCGPRIARCETGICSHAEAAIMSLYRGGHSQRRGDVNSAGTWTKRKTNTKPLRFMSVSSRRMQAWIACPPVNAYRLCTRASFPAVQHNMLNYWESTGEACTQNTAGSCSAAEICQDDTTMIDDNIPHLMSKRTEIHAASRQRRRTIINKSLQEAMALSCPSEASPAVLLWTSINAVQDLHGKQLLHLQG